MMQSPSQPSTSTAAIIRDGFAVVSGVLSVSEIEEVLAALEQAEISRSRRGGAVYGGRNLLDLPAVAALAASPAIRRLVEPIVDPDPIAVRALFFDKTPQANWPVLWHQDLSLAIAEQHELDGWGPWSTKAGVLHVQPPVPILEAMLAVRLHLDACSADNGPLRVLPGSHLLGRLRRDQIAAQRQAVDEIACEAQAGAALLMRPLLLHASSLARAPTHRRVIHIEFAPREILPSPLAWAQAA